jgi:hypothetical protein
MLALVDMCTKRLLSSPTPGPALAIGGGEKMAKTISPLSPPSPLNFEGGQVSNFTAKSAKKTKKNFIFALFPPSRFKNIKVFFKPVRP